MIKCGKCSSFQNNVYHDTVADVRSCYDGPDAARVERPGGPVVRQTPSAPTSSQVDAIPAGRYAIDPGDGKLHFFKVDKPTEGRWTGYTFVKEQASDEHYPVKGARKDIVLAKIAEDPQEAMLTYGREIGSCGHCGRTLTNEESRARGIGPICFGKMGW